MNIVYQCIGFVVFWFLVGGALATAHHFAIKMPARRRAALRRAADESWDAYGFRRDIEHARPARTIARRSRGRK